MEDALLRQWATEKLSRNFQRLRAPVTAEHAYRRQFGHPSSYADVRLEAVPADSFSFQSVAIWPASVDSDEARSYERGVNEGLIDVLFTSITPYRGCAVTLTHAGHDPVGSSYMAFRAAAIKAAEQLIHDANWELVIFPPMPS